jgi:WD40 repeat protein
MAYPYHAPSFRDFAEMMAIGRFAVLLTIAWTLVGSSLPNPTLAQEPKQEPKRVTDGPGLGDLAGFEAMPQTEGGGNGAFLIAPDSTWFVATSPGATGLRLIELRSGATLRFLTAPGLSIAGVSISADSKTVFARSADGKIVAWDAATGQPADTAPAPALHDIGRLSLTYDGNDERTRVTTEQLSQYRLLTHFPQLKPFDQITLSPTQDYALIPVGAPEWRAFQIWNLKQEKSELFFRLGNNACGYSPFAFDYDGKHLVVGNSGGGSDHSHVDFTFFEISYSGPHTGPKEASATQSLDDRCADISADLDSEFSISSDARFLTRGGGMPGSPEWVVWDLARGKKIASIHPDGLGAVSPDGSTFAVVHDLEHDGSRSRQMMTVRRGGRQTKFELPSSMQADHWRPLVLSPNGKWIASQVGETVAVWSSRDGKLLSEYSIGRKLGNSLILPVSDKGDPLLINDHEGTVFANGRWQPVRSDEHEIIVPLTPNYHAQCGILFCDRVIARLGVVVRKPVASRAAKARRDLLSPDGRFVAIYPGLDKDGLKGIDIVDVSNGRVVMHIDQYRFRFTPDGRHIVATDVTLTLNGNGFVKYDLATAKRVWTMIPSFQQDGFYMIMADGHVRLSRDRHVDPWLVRGFEVRQFDGAAAKQFLGLPTIE